MNQTFLQMLQKYNTNSDQKPLSECLCEPDRFKNFSANSGGLLLDFSRTGMDQPVLRQLLEVAEQSGVEKARQRFFDGQSINFTENRPAMHMALRSVDVLASLGGEVVSQVTETRQRMLAIAAAFSAGH